MTAAAGRVAAVTLRAGSDVPGFDRVMMDGFACRAADIATATPTRPVTLRVTGSLAAGHVPQGGPEPGEAWEVATGAALPPGADVVVPVEETRRHGTVVRVLRALPAGRHVAPRGEDVAAGAVLVEEGDVITPAAVQALVAAGVIVVPVRRRPRVLLLSTGDELRPVPAVPVAGPRRAPFAPDEATAIDLPLPAPFVYNSNAVALAAALGEMGLEVEEGGVVPDDPDALRLAFATALEADADVILTTGGVSVGTRDRVPHTWRELRVRRLLGRLDVKPGGPFFAARARGKWILGLSGSPAACWATFQVLVRPFLLRLAGRSLTVRPVVDVVLAEPFPKASGRPRLLWARLGGDGPPYRARVVTGAGGRLTGIADSTGLLWIPAGTPPLPAGARLRALRLDWPEDRDDLDDLLAGADGPESCKPRPPAPPAQDRASFPDRSLPRAPFPGDLPPAVAVVGLSGSGKTHVIAGLIRRLRARGLRPVAIKHAAHGFDLDRPGTDSQRLAEAGAAAVWLVGPGEGAARLQVPDGADDAAPPDDPRPWLEAAAFTAWRLEGHPPDLLLVEGFTRSHLPKVLVGRDRDEPVPGGVIARVPERPGEEEIDRLAARLVDLWSLGNNEGRPGPAGHRPVDTA